MVENEYRIVGPPGTGKTTWLTQRVTDATEAYCKRSGLLPCESKDVLVSSLTKAAANEFRSRGVELHQDQIATLHAHAYRSLGKPPLCVDGEPVGEWNEQCQPQHKLSVKQSKDSPDRERGEATFGDDLLERYHFHRSRLTDRQMWPQSLLAFASEYETWKLNAGYLDFSDVIYMAFTAVNAAPGNPAVIMVDEAQDHDRAELRLIRKWSKNAEKVLIVGDPDQNLYEWRGADPDAFYEVEIPEENERTLSQSYRVPRAVHARAMEMIGRIRGRKPVEYKPRDFDGAVKHSCNSMVGRGVEYLLDEAEPYIKAGKRVMFLAACEYQLRPLVGELKDRAMPFWNPFARDRGLFNPLTPAKGIPAAQRLRNYLLPQSKYYGERARFWTWNELNSWVEVCRVEGLLKQGMKKEIERRAKGSEETLLSFHDVAECFEEEAIAAMDRDPLGLFKQALLKNRAASIEFAVRVLTKRGMIEIEKRPNVIVGTVHSVKGGEADVVFVAPDLSPQGFDQYESSDGRDATFRLFYVAFTRAKETLVLCAPNSGMAVEW